MRGAVGSDVGVGDGGVSGVGDMAGDDRLGCGGGGEEAGAEGEEGFDDGAPGGSPILDCAGAGFADS